MKNEAEAHAEEDKKEKEKVDKLNSADAMIFQTEKQIKEYGDKLPADKKAEIESALEELKTAHKGQDIPAIDAAMEKMNTIWQQASQEMYKDADGQAPPEGGAGDAGNGADRSKRPSRDGPAASRRETSVRSPHAPRRAATRPVSRSCAARSVPHSA